MGWPVSVSLDPVYTLTDPLGHDIKFNSFKRSVALKSTIILRNSMTTYHGKREGVKIT